MFVNGCVLQHARLTAGRQHALAIAQGRFLLNKSQCLVGQRHKVFPFDERQQAQYFGIRHVPWPDLLLDHVEAGLFQIHFNYS
jgi:hypothetical protein